MNHFKRYIVFWLIILIFIPVLAGCGRKKTADPISESAIKLNTFVTIKIYDSQDRTLLEECMKKLDEFEYLYSRTNQQSELYQLNHRTTDTCPISESLYDLIQTGLDYGRLTEGAFDIAIEPVSSLWDFTAEDPVVPDEESIRAALPYVDADSIHLEDSYTISFEHRKTGIDLGGIAKGYIADQLKDYLVSQGVESAMIDLGGNVLCIGQRPDHTAFRIGIQKPFGDRNEVITELSVNDRSVVSSGVYERYFEKDGTRYHHILDPSTGYPVENHLLSVTILSDSSAQGDALSTSCFVLGLEKGMELIDSTPDVSAMFVTDDYELHYSEGFPRD